MKIFKKIVLALLVVLVGIQFIPTTRNQSNKVSEVAFTKTFNVPDNIQNLLKTSCYDCHSNNTIYPWYNKMQPISWFLEHHIKEAKAELNFSEFGAYSKRKQKSKLKRMISEVRENKMPLSSYILMHKEAKLSKADKALLVNWLSDLRDGL